MLFDVKEVEGLSANLGLPQTQQLPQKHAKESQQQPVASCKLPDYDSPVQSSAQDIFYILDQDRVGKVTMREFFSVPPFEASMGLKTKT